jgi:hypothetical protein
MKRAGPNSAALSLIPVSPRRSLTADALILVFRFTLALAAASALLRPELSVGQRTPSEPEVKAAFVLNFAKFVEWPPESFSSSADPLRVCVVGSKAIVSSLRRLARGKTVAERWPEVREVDDMQIGGCHILFVGSSGKELPHLLESARDMSILTVSDTDGFIAAGGMINLVFDNNRIRFDVNFKAAQAARLKLSSKLLSLAKSVGM